MKRPKPENAVVMLYPAIAQFGCWPYHFDSDPCLVSEGGSQGPTGTWTDTQNEMPNLGTELIDSIPCNLQTSCKLEQFCRS